MIVLQRSGARVPGLPHRHVELKHDMHRVLWSGALPCLLIEDLTPATTAFTQRGAAANVEIYAL